MGLDRGIESGKEKRKQYRGAKAIDRTCRNHGDCPWCTEGRQHRNKKIELIAEDIVEAWEENDDKESIMDFWLRKDEDV